MRKLAQWGLLPLLMIGLVNVPVCYWTAYWGLDWRIGLAGLIVLALAAGWFTPGKWLWGAVLALFDAGPVRRRQLPWAAVALADCRISQSTFSDLVLELFPHERGPIAGIYMALVWSGHRLKIEFSSGRFRARGRRFRAESFRGR